MIGRGFFYNPWHFNPEKDTISVEEKLKTFMLNIELFEKNRGGKKPFLILHRFFKIYANGFDGASGLRIILIRAETPGEAKRIQHSFKQLWNSNAGLFVCIHLPWVGVVICGIFILRVKVHGQGFSLHCNRINGYIIFIRTPANSQSRIK